MSLITLNIYIYGANFSVQCTTDNIVDETINAEKYCSVNSHEGEHTTAVTLLSTLSICAETFNCSLNCVSVNRCFLT